MSDLQRLLVVSHVLHYEYDGRLYAYGPYAREIDIWGDMFAEVVIAAPVQRTAPPGDALPFQRPNISLSPQRETGGTTLLSKATQMLAIPGHLWRLACAMHRVDAIQVRCPGNLGLLGCILAPLFRKPRVAKYASQWSEFKTEPFSWRLQRRLLRSRWWRAPVLVYGQWPNQPPHIIPFFTSILNEFQMTRARASKPRNWSQRPLVALFVGRLSQAKNVHVIIRALADLRRGGDDLQLRIVGDGPMRAELEDLGRNLNLGERVFFEGAVPQGRVLDFYEQAHILVLASQTEGWPKAIAEAMAFGLVCIGSDRGLVPQMLGEGRGLLVQPGDVSGLARALHSIAMGPREAGEMSNLSANWARQFTLEGLREAIRKQLESSWAVNLRDVSAPAPQSSQAIVP